VSASSFLGVPFVNPPATPQISWRNQSDEALRRLQRISRMHLSLFGCAFVWDAYGTHLATYHMEMGGLPPAATLATMRSAAAALVDRQLGPEQRSEHRLTGIPASLMPGRPATGGFGILPLKEHVRGRFATWATRFVLGSLSADRPPAPWVRALVRYLRHIHPWFTPMALFTVTPGGPWFGVSRLPDEIYRLVVALAHLPPAVDIGAKPLKPGDWCCNAPLWGNPYLPNVGVPFHPSTRRGLEHYHPQLMGCGRMRTVGDAVRVWDATTRYLADLHRRSLPTSHPRWHRVMAELQQEWVALVQAELCPNDILTTLFRERANLFPLLRALLDHISPEWQAAARAEHARVTAPSPSPPAPPPSEDAVASKLISRLGWLRDGAPAITLRRLTVRDATDMQLGSLREKRGLCHRAYVCEALGLAPHVDPPGSVMTDFVQNFSRLWRVRWENRRKEAYWRLTVDGIPLAGNCHIRGAAAPCTCEQYAGGTAPPHSPRLHCFWLCPVAECVRTVLSRTLGSEVTRTQLWLVRAPDGVVPAVWDVVCLAALGAMEYGRRYLRSPRLGATRRVERACCRVTADFWAALHDFAELGVPEHGWTDVSAAHPFLAVAGGAVVVRDAVVLPDAL
jgi:hypothetical protein